MSDGTLGRGFGLTTESAESLRGDPARCYFGRVSLGRWLSNHRLIVLAAVVVVGLAVVGGVLGGVVFAGGTSGSAGATPTTGAYAPLTVPAPLVPKPGFNGALIVDPDSTIRQGQDLQMIVSPGSSPRHYTLTFTNASSLGWINSFKWFPPTGVQIAKVVSSSAGHCYATGTSGLGGKQFGGVVANPEITCENVSLKPPTCTCRGDGGTVRVSIVSTAPIHLPGSARVDTATPVLKIIPSAPPQSDLPKCAAGQTSTAANPCSSS
jgi:hypothetical protein